MSDDITFCGSDCGNKKCFRHPSNIAEPSIPHSFSYFKDTEDCPYKVKNTMTPEKAVECVISLLQSCKGKNGCLGYIERYFYKEDEQAIDIAIQLLKEGEVYMTSKDFDLYLEGYKQGRKDFDRPKGEWIPVSERLPEEGQDVLVCIIYKDTTHFAVTRLLNNKQWLLYSEVEVIAWQPLPEPYKRGEEENA